MNYQKALNILGLSDNYTDEELKKAYRNLAKKYHPDVNSDKIDAKQREEKLKEINAAKEYLETYKRANKQHDGYDEKDNEDPIYKNIDIYKDEQARDLFDIIKYYKDYQNLTTNREIKKIARKYGLIIENYIQVIISLNSKEKVDETVNKAKISIQEMFAQIKEEFYKEKQINEQDVTEMLNYSCTLKEFVEQLTKIEQKYSKQNNFTNFYNIEKYKENTILKMRQIINFNQIRKLDSYINDYQYCQKQINKLMNLIVQYENIFKAISNINQIDYYFNAFKEKTSEVYDEIKKQYYQENDILESDVTEQLNYDCEIKDFCEQLILINIKDKQRKESQLISRLENEKNNYKYIPLYDEIQTLIEKCISKALDDIKNNNFKNTDQIIKQMRKDINNMFKRYTILKARLIKIEPKIVKNNNELLNKIFNDIKKTCGKIDLEQSEIFLDNLESKIKDKQAKNNNSIENVKETKTYLKSIRNQIMFNFKSNKQENNETKRKNK